MKARSALLVLVMVALAMPLAGCQKIMSTLTPKAPIVTQEATAAASGAQIDGKLPEGLPQDLPLWPGARVRDAQADEAMQSLVLETTEAYDDVVAGVAVGFERAGWKAVQVSEEGSATVLEVSKSGFDGLVTVYGKAAGATIEYLLTPTE